MLESRLTVGLILGRLEFCRQPGSIPELGLAARLTNTTFSVALAEVRNPEGQSNARSKGLAFAIFCIASLG